MTEDLKLIFKECFDDWYKNSDQDVFDHEILASMVEAKLSPAALKELGHENLTNRARSFIEENDKQTQTEEAEKAQGIKRTGWLSEEMKDLIGVQRTYPAIREGRRVSVRTLKCYGSEFVANYERLHREGTAKIKHADRLKRLYRKLKRENRLVKEPKLPFTNAAD